MARLARTTFGKRFYKGLAWVCVSLGTAGIVLPLLPTTPFLLLAAWAASRGSPGLVRRLYRDPRFGPLLVAWHRQRAIPVKAKTIATLLLASSWAILWLSGTPVALRTGLGIFFIGLAVFLWSRPVPNAAGTRLRRPHRLPGARPPARRADF